MDARVDARVVLLDAGMTLLGPSPSWQHHFAAVCHEHDVDVNEEHVGDLFDTQVGNFVRRVQKHDDGMFSISREKSHVFWTEMYAEFLAAVGVTSWPSGLLDRLYERFEDHRTYALYPEVLDTLIELRRMGWRLGVVSNWEGWLDGLLGTLGVSDLLDACVVSGVVGVEKPDAAIFEHALAVMGAKPEYAVMVGDSLEADVHPAVRLGMNAVLVDRTGGERGSDDPGCPPGCARVADLAGLPALLADSSG